MRLGKAATGQVADRAQAALRVREAGLGGPLARPETRGCVP